MVARGLMLAALVTIASVAINMATADEALAPGASVAALDGADFTDPNRLWEDAPPPMRLRFDVTPRYLPNEAAEPDEALARSVEFALASRAGFGGLDVSIAQRASFGIGDEGEIAREGRASELRLGRGMARRANTDWSQAAWYVFAAAEDEALTWRPGARNEFGGSGARFALQDRVEIGDMQAGITYERGPLQASLAYVEREVSTYADGHRTVSEEERFTALTLTMRH